MVSNDQYEKMKKAASLIGNYALANPSATNVEVAKALGFTKSSVERYLGRGTDPESESSYYSLMSSCFDAATLQKIHAQQAINKQRGKVKGGIVSTTVNVPIRDEEGHFMGNKPR